MTSNMTLLQGVSRCCAKTHTRTYRVTPDLRRHVQQLPYSTLLLVIGGNEARRQYLQ